VEAQLRVEEGSGAGTVHVLRPGQTRSFGQVAVRVDGERLLVVDKGAAEGTFLNDLRLPPNAPHEAQDGDALRLGQRVLRVELSTDDGRPVPRRAGAVTDGVVPREEFEVLRELGRGAAGIVLEARRRADGRPVALKVLAERVAPGSADHERFLREGRLAAGLRSPHIVEVLDLRVTPRGQAFLVMELVRGRSLEAALSASGPLAVPDALRVASHVASALVVASAAGVVHRDVKPANVLVTTDGGAKLADFGVARSLSATARSLTASGQGLGTMAYMAPEQVCEARHVDPRADLYGLGATLYHALAGRPPFSPTTLEALYATVSAPAPSLLAARPDCPAAVAGLVHGLLEKDPFERRPPSARQLVRALEALRTS
jgi:serine/threonine-protein kinase